MHFRSAKLLEFRSQVETDDEWRDAPVMHAQIETPAFAGVSLAGL
jgi:hypothetical protein